MFKMRADTVLVGVYQWLWGTAHLLICTFYCIQGAYAAIQMDASNVTVTVTAMCHAEVQ